MNAKVACITLDIEKDFHDPDSRIRLFENPALLDRYVGILDHNHVNLTAFLVTSLIDRYGIDYERLSDRIPLEFAIHSHEHNIDDPCARADIERSVRSFHDFAGHDPLGYRAPCGQITREGMSTLLDMGFRYDSSVYPSIRPGKEGYNNLGLPVVPFRVHRDLDSIIELPFVCLPGVRLVFSLSYIKLFGWRTYELLMRVLHLPDTVVVLTHPYDHYFQLVPSTVDGWEKRLMRRNEEAAFTLLERMLRYLRDQGYEFRTLSEACDRLDPDELSDYTIESAIKA